MYRQFQNPTTGRVKEVKVGYSWTVFFWGLIPMLCRADWLTALLSFAVAFTLNMFIPSILFVAPSVIFYAVVAYFYNEYYSNQLLKKGYVQIG